MNYEAAASVAESRAALEAIRFGCVRAMELACGTLVTIASTERKLALSRQIWAMAQAAEQIGIRLPGLRSSVHAVNPANPGYVAFTNAVAESADPELQYDALTCLMYPDLRAAIMAHYARLPTLADELTRDCLETVLEKLDAIATMGNLPGVHLADLRAMLHGCGGVTGALDVGRSMPRVTRALAAIPARPHREAAVRERDETHTTSPADRSPAAMLHNTIFRIEMCAAEICATMIAYHPDAPWPLRYDLAKQVRDEARHFELFAARMEELGGAIGDHPIRNDVWYKFLVGETLVERLMIEQRIGEGTGLDSAQRTLRRLRLVGDVRTAQIYEYVLADEITHVGNGSAWVRRLAGDADDLTRMEERIRARLDDAGFAVPLVDPINAADRLLSGFTEPEIEALQEARRKAQQSGTATP